MSAMDDFFGGHPLRPDHPDFWRLSEIVLANDGMLAEVDASIRREVWERMVSGLVDVDSLSYMATQRTMRVLGPPTLLIQTLHARVAALYVDAFLTGVPFEQRGGKQ